MDVTDRETKDDSDRLQNEINELKSSLACQRYLTNQRDAMILEIEKFRNDVEEFIFHYSDWEKLISDQKCHIDMVRRLVNNQNEYMLKYLWRPNQKVEGFCAVCLIREPDMVLDNCGHYIMCQVCVNSISKKECPLCRRTFEKAIKVFRSCGSIEVPTAPYATLTQLHQEGGQLSSPTSSLSSSSSSMRNAKAVAYRVSAEKEAEVGAEEAARVRAAQATRAEGIFVRAEQAARTEAARLRIHLAARVEAEEAARVRAEAAAKNEAEEAAIAQLCGAEAASIRAGQAAIAEAQAEAEAASVRAEQAASAEGARVNRVLLGQIWRGQSEEVERIFYERSERCDTDIAERDRLFLAAREAKIERIRTRVQEAAETEALCVRVEQRAKAEAEKAARTRASHAAICEAEAEAARGLAEQVARAEAEAEEATLVRAEQAARAIAEAARDGAIQAARTEATRVFRILVEQVAKADIEAGDAARASKAVISKAECIRDKLLARAEAARVLLEQAAHASSDAETMTRKRRNDDESPDTMSRTRLGVRRRQNDEIRNMMT
jgi:hypothetical protein